MSLWDIEVERQEKEGENQMTNEVKKEFVENIDVITVSEEVTIDDDVEVGGVEVQAFNWEDAVRMQFESATIAGVEMFEDAVSAMIDLMSIDVPDIVDATCRVEDVIDFQFEKLNTHLDQMFAQLSESTQVAKIQYEQGSLYLDLIAEQREHIKEVKGRY